MYKYKKKNNKGFIALMSAVIISAIIIGFLFTTNRTSFSARFDALDSEFKNVSSDLAEACVNQALLRLSQNYNYLGNETVQMGTDSQGRAETCNIGAINPTTRGTNSTLVTIPTKGSYLNTFSTFQTQATVYNPTATAYVPLPSCYIWANTNSISSGQSVTLGWNSSNATSMKIIAQNNHTYDINPASTPVGSQAIALNASESFVGTVTNSAGSVQCTTPSGYIAPSIIVQPPATCADTVMMFDRTGSMNNTDLSNERNAGSTLLGLYQNATPPGQVGIGSFGGLDGTGASIPTGGLLGKNWSTLTSTLNSITSSNSGVGSNLSDAIFDAATELNSIRHDITKSKVFIFVTDGEPNEPSTGIVSDTGFQSPTANVQNGNGDFWNNPTNAYTSGAGDTSDSVSENDHHRFYNFNFPAIPTGAIISGIEASADAWASTTSMTQNPTSVQKTPTVTINPNQWTNPTRVFVSDNSYATDQVSGHQQGYGSLGFSIPSNSTITGVAVTVEAKSSDSTGCNIGAELSNNNGSSFTATGTQTGSIGSNDAFYILGSSTSLWGKSWLPSDFANGKFAFRLQNIHTSSCTSNATLSVDQANVTVYYTTPSPAPVACELGMDLSYDNGNHFTPTTEKTVTLTDTESTYIFGSSSDNWGRTWGVGDFVNSKFVARIHAIDPGANCDNSAIEHLDWLQIKIHYTQPSDPTTATITAANNAKANGVEIFTVRYSTDTNATAIALLKQISSGVNDYFQSPTTQAGITNIFNTIATQVCPAALPPVIPPNPPNPPPPPPPPPSIIINSWQEV